MPRKPRGEPVTMSATSGRHRRWISYSACVWAVLFAAPHTWCALGISAGFPGGEANHRVMMTSACSFPAERVRRLRIPEPIIGSYFRQVLE